MSDKLKVGIVGLGMGSLHILDFMKHPGCVVSAIADIDETRLKQIGDQHSIKGRYKNLDEMLDSEKLDIVTVATPNKFHKEYAIKSHNAGCHVLCEKPMAMNAEEAREMRAVAEKNGKRLMINFSSRFGKEAEAVKQAIDDNILGEVYFARTVWKRRRGLPGFGGWFGKKELSGGGAMIDLGVHRLDLALWFMGYPKPKSVLAATYNHIAGEKAREEGKIFDVEDTAIGFIRFENGASLELEASWASNIKEKEYLSLDLQGINGGLRQKFIAGMQDWETEFMVERGGDLYDLKLHSTGHQAGSAMYHFVDSIINDTPHMATADEGIIVMEILDALYKSSSSAKAVDIIFSNVH